MNSDPFLIAVGIIGTRELTDELLNEVISMLPRITPGINLEQLDRVRKQLESTIGVSMAPGQVLHGGEQQPWLEDLKPSMDWIYWNAYSSQLKSSGFGPTVVRVLDEDSDNILNECGNPKTSNDWRIQGLVMGDVQSGKTANYCGLINKAADAGYKIIVLLTGTIEVLRAQTQERLDKDFVGRDSKAILADERERKPIGVGRFRTTITPNVLTSIDSDFLTSNKRALGGIALENITQPVLLVMKKNRSPLENLIAFLDSQMRKGANQIALPLLLIDDEADNASVNSKKDEDPAKINKLIRDVLKRFGKSTYVGFTATPFANVFINPDNEDLFPSNFVYSLNAPTNYIGAASIFSDSGQYQYQLQDITDASHIFPYKHKKDLTIAEIPRSLEDSLDAFLLTCAIRDLRNEPLKHRSMLINVTRFTDVQDRLAITIKDYLYGLIEEIKQYLAADGLWEGHVRLARLHETWLIHYSQCEFSWDQVRKVLYSSIASVKVVTINQKSEQSSRLNYGAYKDFEKGRRVIAVGGLTLSRGLTLEGLCISYFLRNSKAYDTLLQMGRWFGFRPGYDDLCRIWMDPDVQDWFAHIAEVVDELRLDIKRMHANGQPPSRFGMRVRSHPDALIVTALSKMRNAQEVELSISFSNAGIETPFLPNDIKGNEDNLICVSNFLSSLGPADMIGNRCYWKGISATQVAGFLRNMDISNMNTGFIPDLAGTDRPLISFIAENNIGVLSHWDICLPQGDGTALQELSFLDSTGKKRSVNPRLRQFEKVPKGMDYLKLNKQRVGEISDEMIGLLPDDITAANLQWATERARDPKKGVRVPGYVYRHFRQRPLLTIHIIEPSDPSAKNIDRMMKVQDIKTKNLVAVSLSFPPFDDGEEKAKVPYRLNKVALRNMGLITEMDDEDED